MSYISRKAGGPGALGAALTSIASALTPKKPVVVVGGRATATRFGDGSFYRPSIAPITGSVSSGLSISRPTVGLSLPGTGLSPRPGGGLSIAPKPGGLLPRPLSRPLNVLGTGKAAFAVSKEAAAVSQAITGDTTGGSITQGGGGGGVYSGGGGGGGSGTTAPSYTAPVEDNMAVDPVAAGGKLPTIVIVAGVGLIAYALLKKKRK